MNEFDWPQASTTTGYYPSMGGKSIYMMLRERNLCNHRAFQKYWF